MIHYITHFELRNERFYHTSALILFRVKFSSHNRVLRLTSLISYWSTVHFQLTDLAKLFSLFAVVASKHDIFNCQLSQFVNILFIFLT